MIIVFSMLTIILLFIKDLLISVGYDEGIAYYTQIYFYYFIIYIQQCFVVRCLNVFMDMLICFTLSTRFYDHHLQYWDCILWTLTLIISYYAWMVYNLNPYETALHHSLCILQYITDTCYYRQYLFQHFNIGNSCIFIMT